MDFLVNVFSYDQLRFIWWLLVGVLMLGYALTDGFDVGIGILLHIIGRTDNERRIMINTVAPHWDGNQVWLLTAGGAMFAAWPIVYATAFSGFYLALILVLMALFFRPLAFEYRSKIDSPGWRTMWDWGLTIGSLIPALVIGVAFGNLLQGVPFDFIPNQASSATPLIHNINMPFYHGGLDGKDTGGAFSGFLGLLALLNWYGLIAGVLSVLMLVTHGAAFLQMKTDGVLLQRSEKAAIISSLLAALLFIVAGILLYTSIHGYEVQSWFTGSNAASVPSKSKEVAAGAQFWFKNYSAAPLLWIFPILGVVGFLGAALGSKLHKGAFTFVGSSLACLGVIFTAGVSMFPFVMPSSTVVNHSLTMWDGTASYSTLGTMTLVALVMTPIVLAYTAWGYYVMRGRLNSDYVRKHSNTLY